MTYNTKYNAPRHWRAVTRTPVTQNRNRRKYIIAPEVGKPFKISVPVLYLIKSILNNAAMTSKAIKKYFYEKNVKINGKLVHNRELICINDVLTVDGSHYKFLLKNLKKVFAYELVPISEDEKSQFIIDKCEKNVYMALNGQRVYSELDLEPGVSLYTNKSILTVLQHTHIVPLIGNSKFNHIKITQFKCEKGEYIVLGEYDNKNYKIHFNVDDLKNRRYLLLKL